MKNGRHILVCSILLCLLSMGCGPGWDGYADNYSDLGPVPDEPWEGDEFVYVALGADTVKTALEGLETYDFQGQPAVLLSELIQKSGVTGDFEAYRYDFTATDGYNLYIKRYEDITLLPSWQEMEHGYLYWDTRFNDLTSGWTEQPWGSAVSAYRVKWMNGGLITLLPE